jgi:hypothetical protein
MWPKPASEHPEWKWTMMWKSWQMLCDFSVRAKYTFPDYFDMYIFNDWHGYGIMELAENAVSISNHIPTRSTIELTLLIGQRLQQRVQ